MGTLRRALRTIVAAGMLVAAPAAAARASPQAAFTFEQAVAKAQALAAADPHPREQEPLPEVLAQLSYDRYRKILFRNDASLWRADGLAFQVQFFHRGYLYHDAVRVHVIGEASELAFAPAQFEYLEPLPAPVPEHLGYAGCKILYPLNDAARHDEIVSFLGASYFRLLGAGQVYGLSARGLAIDTASPAGEEFPAFTEFWLQKPGADDRHLELYALLESARIVGAYRFDLTPGAATTARVHAVLFARKRIDKVGIAPLTAMFKFGENRTRYLPDFRPEAHDADGLLIDAGTEWLWRPLDNPEKVHRVTRFACQRAQGFGLLQRDRRFASYQDLQARYDRCPSVWVELQAMPRRGTIELIEIPSATEFNDNVAAYFLAEAPVEAGQKIELDYTLRAFTEDLTLPPLAHATATFVQPGDAERPALFLIDFAGASLARMGTEEWRAEVTADRGEVQNVHVQALDGLGGQRLFFDLAAGAGDPIELRARLLGRSQPITETWVYHWTHP